MSNPLYIVLVPVATIVGLLLLMPLYVLALPLWIVSATTRGMTRLLEPRFSSHLQLIEFDPILGWRSRPHLSTHHFAFDFYRLTTDAHGWSGHASLDDCDVVVFGDSFVTGYGVHARDLFANVHRTPRIKPIGAVGYSMVQELLCMRQLSDRLRGKQVLWFVFHGNDLYDNLMPELFGYRKPFVRHDKAHGGWEVVSSHIRPERWPITSEERLQGRNHFPRLAELCADTFLAKRAYSACEYLIGEGKRACINAGVQLTVLTIPDATQLSAAGRSNLRALGGNSDSFDPDRPDNHLEAACRRWDVAFLAGKTFLDVSCYKENDCHWNEKGHRRVADMLVQLYRSKAAL